jgi:simple sugar transport system permease protein
MLGGLDPTGAAVAGIFFSILINGANAMSWSTGVPSFLSDLIQAQTLITFLILGALGAYRIRVGFRRIIKLEKPSVIPSNSGGSRSSSRITLGKKTLTITFYIIMALAILVILGAAIQGSYLERMISSIVGLTLVSATPIIFASLGEMLIEKTGVLNLGILGIMIAGAGWGFMAAYLSGSILIGILAAASIGALLGLLHALLVVSLGCQQHISGIAITFYAMNLTYFTHRVLIGSPLVEPTVPATLPLKLGPLGDLPIIGSAFSQSPYTYAGAYILPLILIFILARTRWGLVLRAVGENPRAADSSLIRVHAVRYYAILAGSALMAIGGAFYSLIDLRSFNLNVGGEWSWIAMALVVLGNWNSAWIWLACIFFGFLNALQAWLVTVVQLPYQFFQSIPYLLTVAVSAALGKRARPPKAFLQPYFRE